MSLPFGDLYKRVANLESRCTAIEVKNSAQEAALSALRTQCADLAARCLEIEKKNTAQETDLAAIHAEMTALAAKVSAVEGDVANLYKIYAEWFESPEPPPLPIILSLTPTHAEVGDPVTIAGSNFEAGGTVTFGLVTTTTSSWTPTSIVCTVPQLATGATTVRVINANGTSNGMSFTVDPEPPSGEWNVRDYGATGNGTTDDRATIQAAIDACYTAGGGTVYIPAGTYRLASVGQWWVSNGANLLPMTGVHIRGDGPSSILQGTMDNAAIFACDLDSYRTGGAHQPNTPGAVVWQHDFSISHLHGTSSAGIASFMKLASVRDVDIHDCTSSGTAGIRLYASQNVTVANCYIENAWNSGFVAHNTNDWRPQYTDNVEFLDCEIWNSYPSGFRMEGYWPDYKNRVNNVRVTNCYAHNNYSSTGMKHNCYITYASNLTFTNCDFDEGCDPGWQDGRFRFVNVATATIDGCSPTSPSLATSTAVDEWPKYGSQDCSNITVIDTPQPEVWNVEDYGAVHNGNLVTYAGTDDRDAINNAINACSAAGGGIVYLPTGVYRVKGGSTPLGVNSDCGGSIHLKDNVTIQGDGPGNTILLYGFGSPDYDTCIVASRRTNIGIRDLEARPTTNRGSVAKIYNCDYSYIENVVGTSTTGSVIGISNYGCRNSTIKNCTISGYGQPFKVSESYLYQPVYSGYGQSDNNYIIGCTALNSSSGAFSTQGYQVAPYTEPNERGYAGAVRSSAHNIHYVDCYCDNGGAGYGFTAAYADNITYTNCGVGSNFTGWGLTARWHLIHAHTVSYTDCTIGGLPLTLSTPNQRVIQENSGAFFEACGGEVCTGVTVTP